VGFGCGLSRIFGIEEFIEGTKWAKALALETKQTLHGILVSIRFNVSDWNIQIPTVFATVQHSQF
jgi:hypothetical protein